MDREFDFQSYYGESYFQGGVDDGYADYIGSESALRAEFQQVLTYLLKKTQGRAALLEFGSAYGFFLREAARHFAEAEGIELSADAARYCKEQGLKVAQGMVDDTTLGGPYDVAVGLDVIEHLSDPQETVRLVAARLKPGGALLLTTGDWGSLLARVMGKGWRLMTPPQHLSFFTEASMKLMVENAGLRVVELSHPWKRVPVALVLFQLQRIAGLKPRKVSGLNSVGIPINLWDSMRVLAVKPDPQARP
jgi:2-polyprenyl-3-methyl-5-hydroxy-6-metoxy-1,4-benzoquinol methylase